MANVRIGIIGVGNMGYSHASKIFKGEVPDATLAAVCDSFDQNITRIKELGATENIQTFKETKDFFDQANIDAVIIATPHFSHPELAMKSFDKGWHVLLEKPAGVHTKSVKELNAAAQKTDKIFSLMFNQRTNPLYKKARELVQGGELGGLKRVEWTITNWYRPQAYYDSGSWRATWGGEGGGVLLNQCPHNLDLLQWICGMPKTILAKCAFGKYHTIPVEDDVTAFLEYENGATGVFITTTGEYPGTNRLEIAGDFGKIVIEGDDLTFYKTDVSERVFNEENKEAWCTPKLEKITYDIDKTVPGHVGIMKNFVNHINGKEDLLAPGEEGINSLTLSNGMLLSTWQNKTVNVPIDDEAFYQILMQKIEEEKKAKA